MGIRDEMAALTANPSAPSGQGTTRRCKAALMAEALPPEAATDYLEVLRDKAISVATIVKWVRSKQLDVSEYTIVRHRRGTCACR